MMNVSRSVRKRWCSIAVLIVFAVAMLTASNTPNQLLRVPALTIMLLAAAAMLASSTTSAKTIDSCTWRSLIPRRMLSNTFRVTNEDTTNVLDKMRFNRSKPMGGKAKQCILVCFIAITITLALLPSTASADAVITAAYPNFNSTNIDVFQLNGNATLSGDNRLQLTPSTKFQFGTAWWKNRISLDNNRSFSTYFTFQIYESDNNGADGIVFVIQTQSSGAGAHGGGIGYTGIRPSVGIEFDTYNNAWDPDDNHIGVDTDGSTTSLTTVTPPGLLENGIWHAWVDYNGTNGLLEVRMNTSITRPELATLNHVINLEAAFGPDVYVGFTSATGGARSKHEICSFYFNNDYIPKGITPDNETYISAPTKVELTAAPTLIPADGVATSIISAKPTGVSGNPLVGQTINFTTTMGTVSPISAVTNESGVATTTLYGPSETSGGEAIVRGSAECGIYGETQVTFGGKCTCGDICVNETGWWRYVGAFNDNVTPIQAAVNNATPGETICVWNGSYSENVNVDKRLTLAGEGADVVNVTAASTADHVFTVTADYVNISGFNVTGATGFEMAGIYLGSNADHCNISDNTVDSNNYGIYLYSSSNNTIYNNYFNNIQNAYDNGYNIWNTTPTTGTNIIGGRYLGGNYWSDYTGADTIGGDDLGDTLIPYNSSGNIQNGGDYHPLVQRAPIFNCTCGDICVNTSGWWRHGDIFNASDTTPIQAAVNNATPGETVCVCNGSYSENVNVDKRLTLAGEGADVVNVTAASTADHVFTVTADYVNISGFNVTGATGFEMAGIYLGSNADHCNISDNTVDSNNYGIYLYSSSNNTIYNNYFNNTQNAYDNGYNIWNTTPTTGTNIIGGPYLGGNYWPDYAGVDMDGDGLGDTLTPYNSSGNIQHGGDYHPLVTPGFAAPDITSSAPESPVNGSCGTWRTFNVSVDQIVKVTWYLDGTAQTPVNASVTEASYTLHAEHIGEHNVSAVAENANGTDMQTWVWNVTGESTLPAVTINTPTTAYPVYITGGEQFQVNFTYTELYPANYTVKVGNSTTIINSITRTSVAGGTDMTANEIFYLDSTASDGWYNVSVELYDASSNCNIAYQNNSVAKGIVNVWIDSANICRDPLCRTTVNITLNNVRNYGSGAIHLYFNETFIRVNSTGAGDSDTVVSNRIEAGHWIISASHSCTSASDPCGLSGNVVFANVTFEPVEHTAQGRRCIELGLVVETLYDLNFSKLATITSNGSICNGDADAPILTIPIASPQTILNDNGRARVPGTNITRITATVTDDIGVDTVTINLTPIRGPGHDAVAMTRVAGAEEAGDWSIDTNADYDPGVNLTHNLTMIATDYSGKSVTVNVTLTVLRRGDVDRNNVIDMEDYNEIAKHVVELKPAPYELVAGVVAADRFDGVDMSDALYILMHIYCGYPAP